MSFSGKYIYGIIASTQDQRFGPIGLQGEEVLSVGMDDLAMIISHYENESGEEVKSSRKNLLAHQKVLERIMEEHTVLPVKFGTIAAHEGEIHNLILRHYKGFKKNLQSLENKIELGLKVMWKDMKSVYDEILEENEQIKNLKLRLQDSQHTDGLIEIGKMVENALDQKKNEEAEKILNELKPSAIDTREGKLIGDQMILNASFLVSKGREKEFDNNVNDLSDRLEHRYKFSYVGPLAPYNFVDLGIYPESWEK